MEQKLKRFHTSYDDYGRANYQGIFETQRVRHQDSIKQFDRIAQFKQQNFTLRQLDHTFATTPAIVNHPKYKAIHKLFNSYNDEIKPYTGQSLDAFNTKKQIMDATMSMFRLMVLSPSVESKVTILELTHEWVFKQLNPKQLRKPKRDLVQQLKIFLKKKNFTPVQNIDITLPSGQVKLELQDYKNNARTYHQDQDAPAFELEQYISHKVNVLQSRALSLNKQLRRKQPKVLYSKPNHYDQTISKNSENSLNLSLNRTKIGNIKQLEESTYRTEEQKLQALENQALVLELQREPTDENQQILENIDNEGPQVIYDQRQGKASVQGQEEVEEKKGKLDPQTQAYIYSHPHHNQKERVLSSINHIEQPIYHKTLFKNREDSVLLKRVSAWAGARSQFKTELARKIQSNRTFFGPKKQKETGQIHTQMQQMRVNHALREGRKFLRQEEDFSKERLNSQPGLSVFSHNRHKVASVKSTKTFQSILKENSIHNTSDSMMEEVQELKSKLASKKVYASLALLQKSIMPPEEVEMSVERLKTERPLFLMSNPLVKKKKKRKVTKRR